MDEKKGDGMTKEQNTLYEILKKMNPEAAEEFREACEEETEGDE